MNQSKFRLKNPRNQSRYRKYWIDAITGKKFFIDSDPFSATPENSQPPSPEKQQSTNPAEQDNDPPNNTTTRQNNPQKKCWN
jgi:hypothetical protein